MQRPGPPLRSTRAPRGGTGAQALPRFLDPLSLSLVPEMLQEALLKVFKS